MTSAYRYAVCVARMTPERASALLGTNARASRTTVHRAWSTKAATLGVKGLVARDVLYRIADELDDEEETPSLTHFRFKQNWAKAGLAGVEWLMFAAIMNTYKQHALLLLGKRGDKWVAATVDDTKVASHTFAAAKVTPLVAGIRTLLRDEVFSGAKKWNILPEGFVPTLDKTEKLRYKTNGVPIENALAQLKLMQVKGPVKDNPYYIEFTKDFYRKYTDKWREMLPGDDTDLEVEAERAKAEQIAAAKARSDVGDDLYKTSNDIGAFLRRLDRSVADPRALRELWERLHQNKVNTLGRTFEQSCAIAPKIGPFNVPPELEDEWERLVNEYDILSVKYARFTKAWVESTHRSDEIELKQNAISQVGNYEMSINGRSFPLADATLLNNPRLAKDLFNYALTFNNLGVDRRLEILNELEDAMTTEPTWAILKVREVIEYLESLLNGSPQGSPT